MRRRSPALVLGPHCFGCVSAEVLTSTKHGVVWWTELNTNDPEAARTFYCEVIGWTAVEVAMNELGRSPSPGEATYTTLMNGETPVCGIFDLRSLEGMENVPPHWLTFISVADVNETCEQVEGAGGSILKPPFDVPGVGRIAIVKDVTGAVIGLGTPE